MGANNKALTDEQKARIVALYAVCGNKAQVARDVGVSSTSVYRVLAAQGEKLREAVAQKKEAISDRMLEHLDSLLPSAQELLSSIMGQMLEKAESGSLNLTQLATTFGIMVDKFTLAAPKVRELNAKADNLVSSTGETAADDGFIAAMKGSVGETWQGED